MDDKLKAAALLMSDDIAKYMAPVIKRLTDDVNNIVSPVTTGLRNELKESTRRVDGISADLSKQLLDFKKQNDAAKRDLGTVAVQVTEAYDKLEVLVKSQLEELLKPVAHGLVNDVRQASSDERERLCDALQQVTDQAENAVIKLQTDKKQSVRKNLLMIAISSMIAVSMTLVTLIVRDTVRDPVASISARDKNSLAAGRMFLKVWPNYSQRQQGEYRILADQMK